MLYILLGLAEVHVDGCLPNAFNKFVGYKQGSAELGFPPFSHFVRIEPCTGQLYFDVCLEFSEDSMEKGSENCVAFAPEPQGDSLVVINRDFTLVGDPCAGGEAEVLTRLSRLGPALGLLLVLEVQCMERRDRDLTAGFQVHAENEGIEAKLVGELHEVSIRHSGSEFDASSIGSFLNVESGQDPQVA